jgi:hypothetical protein
MTPSPEPAADGIDLSDVIHLLRSAGSAMLVQSVSTAPWLRSNGHRNAVGCAT